MITVKTRVQTIRLPAVVAAVMVAPIVLHTVLPILVSVPVARNDDDIVVIVAVARTVTSTTTTLTISSVVERLVVFVMMSKLMVVAMVMMMSPAAAAVTTAAQKVKPSAVGLLRLRLRLPSRLLYMLSC